MRRVQAAIRGARAEDPGLFAVLAAFALVQLWAATWDLPGSFTWEIDAIAPRILFTCLRENFTPHQGCQYPLVQTLIITVLSLPVLIAAVLTAPEFTGAAIEARMMDVAPMTGVSAVGKIVAIAMMWVALHTLARIARKTFGPTAARWAVLFAIVNVTASYYGRTTNADGPYMMWTLLALNRAVPGGPALVRADYVWFGVFAALALATKDQAYAAFVLTVPIYLLALPLRAGIAARAVARDFAAAAGAGAGVYLVLAPVVANPSGWLYRMSVLLGRGSEDYRLYPRGAAGVLENARDLFVSQPQYFWPWPAVALAWAGVLVAVLWPEYGGARRRVYRLLPLLAGLSAVACFTLVAARSEHRFVLPMAFALSFYAGVAVAGALAAVAPRADAEPQRARRLRAAVLSFAGALWFGGAVQAAALIATQQFDARRFVERSLAALPAGSVVETYGRGTILPRFATPDAAPYRVRRVEAGNPRRRAKLPGVDEVQAEFGAQLAPQADVLVVPEALWSRSACGPARTCTGPEPDPYFRRAATGQLPGYAAPQLYQTRFPAWLERLGAAPIAIHGSTHPRLFVVHRSDRNPGPAPASAL